MDIILSIVFLLVVLLYIVVPVSSWIYKTIQKKFETTSYTSDTVAKFKKKQKDRIYVKKDKLKSKGSAIDINHKEKSDDLILLKIKILAEQGFGATAVARELGISKSKVNRLFLKRKWYKLLKNEAAERNRIYGTKEEKDMEEVAEFMVSAKIKRLKEMGQSATEIEKYLLLYARRMPEYCIKISTIDRMLKKFNL